MAATRFGDRTDAGRKLAARLSEYAERRPVVLALPRGGVPVGYEIARALHAPLDVWVVRKLGVPWHPELGMGAVSEGGYLHLSHEILDYVGLSDDELSDVVEAERAEVERRVRRFRGDRPLPELRGRTVILVDDGIATGGTVHAAITAIRAEQPRAIVLAVPVAATDTLEALASEVDQIVCLIAPPSLYAIGLWYEDFRQLSDDEVAGLLERARAEQPGPEPPSHALGTP
jgi:putative phosphoribosyl transferase